MQAFAGAFVGSYSYPQTQKEAVAQQAKLAFGRGLARTRFSNFARICLAMSSCPYATGCGGRNAKGAQMACPMLSETVEWGRGACTWEF